MNKMYSKNSIKVLVGCAPCQTFSSHVKESGQSHATAYGCMNWNKAFPIITIQFTSYGSGRFGHSKQDKTTTPFNS